MLTLESQNGLGLLKTAMFIFFISEYLAAYHISTLPKNTVIKLLNDTFWDIQYFNTWIMYVGITGGKAFAWKHFISAAGNPLQLITIKTNRISKKFLRDKVKSLHLFQCYSEVKDDRPQVETFFDGDVIDLSDQRLLPTDINTLCFFLLRANKKQWNESIYQTAILEMLVVTFWLMHLEIKIRGKCLKLQCFIQPLASSICI